MVITALLIGLVTLLQEHYRFQSDWHWAGIAAAAMMTPLAAMGGLFLAIATLILKRQGPSTTQLSN